jgi:hypothetical protein
LLLKEGYWRTDKFSPTLRVCPLDQSCLGGKNTSGYCEDGYKGPLCALCADSYYFDSDIESCVACTEENSKVSVKLIVFAILIFGLLLLSAALQSNLKNKLGSCYLAMISRGTRHFEKHIASFIEKHVVEGYEVTQNKLSTTFEKDVNHKLRDVVETDTNVCFSPLGSIVTMVTRRTKGIEESNVKMTVEFGVFDSRAIDKVVRSLKRKAKNQLKSLASFFQSNVYNDVYMHLFTLCITEDTF